MMEITFILNSDFQQFLEGNLNVDYRSSNDLLNCCLLRGHDVKIVHPEDAIAGGFSKIYHKKGTQLVETGKSLDTDVLFLRGLGENRNSDVTNNLIFTLESLEGNVPLIINTGKSTSYEGKDKQKTLPLPFIPHYKVNSFDELEDLVNEHSEGIIIKPIYGLLGLGVEYVQSVEDIDKWIEERNIVQDQLKSFVFEKFIPEQLETRYIFLFGEIVASRTTEKIGHPGKERYGFRFINKEYPQRDVDVVKKSMELTEMQFGAVDFRGGYVLEINGSGTGTFNQENYTEGKMLYDLTDRVIDEIEKRVKGSHSKIAV